MSPPKRQTGKEYNKEVMLYCYSVYQTILDAKCTVKKVNMRNAVIRSVAASAFSDKQYGKRDQKLSDMALGRVNLVDDVVNGAKTASKEDVVNHFASKVVPLLDTNEYKTIVQAIKQVLEDDEDLERDTIVDLYKNRTKSDILKCSRFNLPEFLAGLFLYAVERDNNRDTHEYTLKINDAFFDSLKEKATLLRVDNGIDSETIEEIICDAKKSYALAKNDGYCPRCTKPMVYVNEDGQEVDRYDFISLLEGRVIAVCRECQRSLSTGNEALLAEVVKAQDLVESEANLRNLASGNLPARSDIMAVLVAIDDMEQTDATRMTEPSAIKDKIPTERGLQNLVSNLVTPAYQGIQKILNDLSGQNKINKDRLGDKINGMWKAMSYSAVSQRQLFDALVAGLDEKSGHRYQSACQSLVAYYVQRCDVFAPPK